MSTIPDIAIFWTPGIVSKNDVKDLGAQVNALAEIRKNKNSIVWSILSTFEGIPVSLPQTVDILNGKSVNNLALHDMLKIKSYARAVDLLCDMLEKKSFTLAQDVALDLHYEAAKSEVAQYGMFRISEVKLKHVSWKPPAFASLDALWNKGILVIRGIEDPVERACVLFLFLSRSQFFIDCNKRTATLMMNGVLASHGLAPLFFPRVFT